MIGLQLYGLPRCLALAYVSLPRLAPEDGSYSRIDSAIFSGTVSESQTFLLECEDPRKHCMVSLYGRRCGLLFTRAV